MAPYLLTRQQQGEGAVERVQRCEYAELTHTKEYPLMADV